MKALVLSGGSGTRLRPLTFTRSKQLLPLANRPLLHHVLDNIAAAGIEDVVIVTGSNTDEIRESVNRDSSWDFNLRFVTQPEPLGLAHAVLTAEEALGDEPFLMYLGDNILPGGILEYLHAFDQEKPDTLVLLHPVENPQNFGIAVVEGDRVVRMVEKPAVPPGNLALVGIYFFSPVIWEAVHRIKPSARGELEITDAIQYQLENGLQVMARLVKGAWHDAGNPVDLLVAAQTYLDLTTPDTHPDAEIQASLLEGAVRVGAGSRIINSRIRGPVVIGRNCTVRDSGIGPYVSIGDGCRIAGSSMENSILLPNCRISHTPPLRDCIIGEGSELDRDPGENSGVRLIGGDRTYLTF